VARRALGYRSLEAPGNRRRRQMVAVPKGIQNPAYAPLSAHTRRIEFSFVAKYVVRGNDQGTAGRKSSGGRRLTVSPSSKSEFAPRLGQHAEGAVGMEHSSDAFCVLLIFAIKLTLALGGCRSALSPEDARVRTVRP
jgi:hypothetical protein